ncbi:helix-turn-helix domain-containing protein [Streptomyces sp. NPDC057682]|uniref:helix-turn-helix domain-containing protein n=1 Tax=Streptomyces sp. NPDC057682 TaxID=3346210 RepID=UPI0036B64423
MPLSDPAGPDGGPEPAVARVDASCVPEPDRWTWWTEMVSREVMPVSTRSPRPDAFRGRVEEVRTAGVQVAAFDFSPMTATRSAAQIRRQDREEYFLVLLREGRMPLEQGSGSCLLRAGDMTVFSSSHPLACAFLAEEETGALDGTRTAAEADAMDGTGSDADSGPDAGMARLSLLRLPRKLLPLSSGRADRLLAVPLRADAGAAVLLGPYLARLPAAARGRGAAQAARLGSLALDLAAAAIADQLDIREALPVETRQAAVLTEVKAFIEHHLADPRLTPAAIAAHHHLSVRTLHTLFREEPEPVAARIRRRRLERCAADLADPRLRHRTIGEIATRWGLGAHDFSRSFRRVHGVPPSEFRASAHRGSALGAEGHGTDC